MLTSHILTENVLTLNMEIRKSNHKKSLRNTPYDNPRCNYDAGQCQSCGVGIERRKGFIILRHGKETMLCQDCFNKLKRFAESRKENIDGDVLTRFAAKITDKKPKQSKKKIIPRKIKLIFTAMETNRRKH